MIVSFHGIDHKTGCTMLSQCAAESISRLKPELSVLLLHLTEDPGLDFSPQVHSSMEKYLPFVLQGSTDIEEFADRASWNQNLSMAGGLLSPGAGNPVHPDMCRRLLKQLESRYDLILLDTGSSLAQGLALGGLLSSDAVFLIAREGRQSREKFLRNKVYYSRLLPEASYLAINFHGSNPLAGGKEKDAWFQHTPYPVQTIRESPYGSAAEEEGKSLMEYKGSGFAKDLRRLTDMILTRLQEKEANINGKL